MCRLCCSMDVVRGIQEHCIQDFEYDDPGFLVTCLQHFKRCGEPPSDMNTFDD